MESPTAGVQETKRSVDAGHSLSADAGSERSAGMSVEYGTISGRLTITIAGHSVDIGLVKVPMKGRVNGSEIVLSANLAAVRDTVAEILRSEQ